MCWSDVDAIGVGVGGGVGGVCVEGVDVGGIRVGVGCVAVEGVGVGVVGVGVGAGDVRIGVYR